MPIYTASVDYSIDGGKTYQLYDANYTGSISASVFNQILKDVVPPGNKSAIFRTYKSGSTIGLAESDTQTYYVGGTQIKFSSYYSVHEHKYMCIVKRSEFNNTLNVTAYDISGSKLITEENLDTDGKLIKLDTEDGNFSPYATTIGLYDDAEQLVAYAKFANPVKISKDFDSVFIVKFDV